LSGRSFRWWARVAGVICVASIVGWLAAMTSSDAQSPAPAAVQTEDTGVYTTAHSSASAAIREFFGIRSTPVQPIAFTHKVHLASGLQCTFCHVGVDQGPDASLPSTNLCMTCHVAIDPTNPEIQKIAAYQAKGQDIPWQRVYGFEQSAHVKFNHAPHIRAGVDCSTCHGDMTKQTVAVRAVDHTMGFCITCHEQHKVSIDCVTCHY
jgi:hypothetical protein